jgi:hypothetical protein
MAATAGPRQGAASPLTPGHTQTAFDRNNYAALASRPLHKVFIRSALCKDAH